MDEKDIKNLVLTWLVASLVIFFAPFFAPGYVVLGNDRVSSFLAPFVSSLLIVLLVVYRLLSLKFLVLLL